MSQNALKEVSNPASVDLYSTAAGNRVWDRLVQLGLTGKLALLPDFDGCVADPIEKASDIHVKPRMLKALLELEKLIPVVFITGRKPTGKAGEFSLDEIVHPHKFSGMFNHGAIVRLDTNADAFIHPEVSILKPEILSAIIEYAGRPENYGIRLRYKPNVGEPVGIVVDPRECGEPGAKPRANEFLRSLGLLNTNRIIDNEGMLEVASLVTKYDAVAYAIENHAPLQGKTLVAIGDSFTDEDMMRYAKQVTGGYGISVGPSYLPEADASLKAPEVLCHFFEKLASALTVKLDLRQVAGAAPVRGLGISASQDYG